VGGMAGRQSGIEVIGHPGHATVTHAVEVLQGATGNSRRWASWSTMAQRSAAGPPSR
jgi:hypothetical protein